MLGTKESAISFKVYLTFFHENGFRFTIEDQVYPITENDKEQDFSIVKLKKVVEYFDVKTFEYKKQAKIQFDLKVVNEKLDEIAKDKKNSVESGLEDSDGWFVENTHGNVLEFSILCLYILVFFQQ